MKKLLNKTLFLLVFAGCITAAAFGFDKKEVSASSYDSYITSLSGQVTLPYINGYQYGKNMYGKWQPKKKTFDLSIFNYYSVEDINGDGTEELFLRVQDNASAYNCFVMICTMKNGKVVPVFCVGGLRGGLSPYKATGNRICFLFGGSDSCTTVFLKLKGKNLKKVKSYYTITDKSVIPYKTAYYMDKKKVSQNKYLKGNRGVSRQITFYPIS